MGTSEIQGQMWGARPRDWADYGESTSNDLFEEILADIKAPNGTELLDVGCGSGGFCIMASKSGYLVRGIDASKQLIKIARERMPESEFITGEMEELPYRDKTFDVVTGINSFQFAGDIANAIREAGRVTKKGGRIIIAVWGKPEECEATRIFSAIGQFMPPPPASPPGNQKISRKPLYTEGVLEELVSEAGLTVDSTKNITCMWSFESLDTALKAMLSAGGVSIAVKASGEQKVSEAIEPVLRSFKQRSGKYEIRNTFRCIRIIV